MSIDELIHHLFAHTAESGGTLSDLVSHLGSADLHDLFQAIDPHFLVEACQAAGLDPSHMTDSQLAGVLEAALSRSLAGPPADIPLASRVEPHHPPTFGRGYG